MYLNVISQVRVLTCTFTCSCVGLIIDREAREIIRLVASVRPSVCPSVSALTAECSGWPRMCIWARLAEC